MRGKSGRFRLVAILVTYFLVALILMPYHAWAIDESNSIKTVTIQISKQGAVPISPLLYGINYDWNAVPASQARKFASTMKDVSHVTLVRYPGGWNAEAYDWSNNTERPWRKASKVPGVDPHTILKLFPEVSFITPSGRAIKDPAEAKSIAKLSASLVRRYGDQVRYWEIGNEWWLQRGAKKNEKNREENLARYAHLLDVVVPRMKRANPAIKIFATSEWQSPEDMQRLRSLTGEKVWKQIDGISLHTYCGTVGVLCSSLPNAVAKIRSTSGKSLLYASEWAVVRHHAPNDFGIRNADYTVDAIRDMVFARIQLGAYWPPVREIRAMSFESANYQNPFATGIVFGWMSRFYEGVALHTSGDPHAVAAMNHSAVTVLVPSYQKNREVVRIALSGTGMTRVASARVLYSEAPDDVKSSLPAKVAILPTHLTHDKNGKTYVEFVLNPGTQGRGGAYEIAKVILE